MRRSRKVSLTSLTARRRHIRTKQCKTNYLKIKTRTPQSPNQRKRKHRQQINRQKATYLYFILRLLNWYINKNMFNRYMAGSKLRFPRYSVLSKKGLFLELPFLGLSGDQEVTKGWRNLRSDHNSYWNYAGLCNKLHLLSIEFLCFLHFPFECSSGSPRHFLWSSSYFISCLFV